MDRIKIISRFLEYFWEPALRLITDNKDADKKIATNKKMSLEYLLKINESDKYKAGLFFTPNWNYWKWIEEWEKLEIKKDKWKWIYAFFVDLDVSKTWDDIDKAWDEINKVIWAYQIPPSFVVKSWWGWHLYWLLQEDLHKELWLNNFAKIQKFFAELFPYWDDSNVNHIAKLMRVPLTYHWKNWKKLVELYRYTQDRNIEFIETPEQCQPYFRYKREHVQWLLKNIDEFKKTESVQKSYAKRQSSFVEDVKKIKIPDMFDKLPYKYYKGKYYKFKLWEKVWTNTYMIDIVDKAWTIQRTDWYRYKEDENYVHNFSLNFHPIDERPRWGPVPFLYYYLNKDWDQVDKFLREHYNIWIRPDLDDTEQEFKYWELTLTFTYEWVVLYKYWEDWDIKTVKYFEWNWRVLDWTEKPETNLGWVVVDWNLSEEDRLVRFYRLVNLDTWKQILITYLEKKDKFNARYWKVWLRLLQGADPNVLFNILDANANIIPKKTTIYETWYYHDYWVVAVPNDIVYTDWEVDTSQFIVNIDWDYDIKNQKSKFLSRQTPVTVQQAFNEFKELYSEAFSVIGFLQFISMFWFDIWDKLKTIKVHSWLWVFGKTWTWKSTFVEILKAMMWLEFDFKLIDASSWYTTPQGIKKLATDYFPLTIEEFTKAPAHIEEILRWILNHTKWERWYGWYNIKRESKAWLIVLWEDTPWGDSLVNRLVIISLREDNKKSTQKEISKAKLMNMSYDLYKKFYNLELTDDDVVEMMSWIQDKAKDLKINTDRYDRFAETFVKVFLVWEKILWLDRNYIIDLTKQTQNNIVVFNTVNEVATIKDLIYSALIKRKWLVSVTEYRNWNLFEVSIDKWEAAKKRHVLADLKKFWFNVQGWSDMVFLNYFIPNENKTKKDVVVEMISHDIQAKFKNQYSYADQWTEEYLVF